MLSTIREATAQRFHNQTPDERNEYLQTFLLACNHDMHLKTLRGLTPREFIGAPWQKNPAIFTLDPAHLARGPGTSAVFACLTFIISSRI